MTDVPDGWQARGKPVALFRRFEFQRYGATRDFLDALAALSEETGIHPQNINFGTTYVNVTLEGAEGRDIGDQEYMLARRIGALFQPSVD